MKTLGASVIGVLLAVVPASLWSDNVPAWIERLGWTLVHSVWQLFVVALVAALVDRGLRRRSANARYIGGVIALGAVFALPCLMWSLVVVEPRDREPVAMVLAMNVVPVADVLPSELLSTRDEHSPHPARLGGSRASALLEDADESRSAKAREPLRQAQWGAGQKAELGVGTESQPTAWHRLLASVRAVIEPRLSLLVAVWVVGVVLCSLRPVWGLWTQWRLRRVGLSSVPEAVQRTLLDLARRMGLARVVRIAESSLVRVPMVVGYLRPMILLPASVLTGLAPSQLEALLAHELAHVRRHDWLVNALQVLAETLFFFHPAVWWLSKRIRNERELCCDDLALSLVNDKAIYARTLLTLEELHRASFVSTLAATGGDLVQRVRRLMPGESTSVRSTSSAVSALATGLMTAVFALAMTFGVLATSGSDPLPKDKSLDQPKESKAVAETRLFRLKVVGPDGRPVANAKVEFRGSPGVTAEQIQRGKFVEKHKYGMIASANEQGELFVNLPRVVERLSFSVEQPGFGPFGGAWDAEINPQQVVPDEITAQLDAAWSVGGVLVDETGAPVADAQVHPSIEFKKRLGDTKQLGVGAVIRTDAKGAWRYDSVPITNKNGDYVYVSVDHPSFQPLRRPLKRAEFEILSGMALATGDSRRPAASGDSRGPAASAVPLTPTARIEMKRGLIVTGTVTDAAGQPVENALVRSKFINEIREARTDALGAYRLSGCEPGDARIVVSAKGLAVEMHEVRVDAEMKPVDFSLKAGGHVRIRVVDENGRGIPKARIFFQRWRGRFQYFEFNHRSQYADQDGVWEWDEAPLDEFQADICRPDGMQLSSQPLIARADEYVFKPAAALVVTGRVVDAKTKQPIAKFRVTPGLRRADREQALDWRPRDSFDGAAGKYQIRFDDDDPACLVRIEASGYRTATSRDIKPDEGRIEIHFELQPAKDISATIRTASGEPAAGAKIALGLAGSQISIKNGDIDDQSTYATRLDADANGLFRLSARDEPFQLVIMHPAGFASVKSSDGPIPEVLKLTAWARVEGTLRIGQTPTTEVVLLLGSQGIDSHGKDAPHISCRHQTTTGAAGSYVFDRVFPGRARIGREVELKIGSTSFVSSSSHQVTVELVSGKTSELNLGGNGRSVTGQLAAPAAAAEPIHWSFGQVTLSADLRAPPLPPNLVGAAADPALQPQWDKWLKSAAGRAWQTAYNGYLAESENSSRFIANVARDGSFQIDDVPAGKYVLTFRFHRDAPGNLPERRITVPNADDEPLKPVNLGALKLE